MSTLFTDLSGAQLKNFFVCDRHFAASQKVCPSRNDALNRNAIPTLHLPFRVEEHEQDLNVEEEEQQSSSSSTSTETTPNPNLDQQLQTESTVTQSAIVSPLGNHSPHLDHHQPVATNQQGQEKNAPPVTIRNKTCKNSCGAVIRQLKRKSANERRNSARKIKRLRSAAEKRKKSSLTLDKLSPALQLIVQMTIKNCAKKKRVRTSI